MLPRQKWNYSEMKNMNYKFNKSVISLWIYGKEQIRAWKLKTKNSLLPPKTRLTISTTQGRRKLGRSETRGRGSSNVVGNVGIICPSLQVLVETWLTDLSKSGGAMPSSPWPPAPLTPAPTALHVNAAKKKRFLHVGHSWQVWPAKRQKVSTDQGDLL